MLAISFEPRGPRLDVVFLHHPQLTVCGFDETRIVTHLSYHQQHQGLAISGLEGGGGGRDCKSRGVIDVHKYHDNTAVEEFEGVTERIDGFNVEIVRGLIEEQQMWGEEGQLHEHHACLLSATQITDGDGVSMSLQTILAKLVADGLVGFLVEESSQVADGVLIHG